MARSSGISTASKSRINQKSQDSAIQEGKGNFTQSQGKSDCTKHRYFRP